MLGEGQDFESFLGNSTSVLILTEAEHVALELEVEDVSLLDGTILEHFLKDVVAKDILHKPL
jgi:hypothetical protein